VWWGLIATCTVEEELVVEGALVVGDGGILVLGVVV
jgi:hypothetical protein